MGDLRVIAPGARADLIFVDGDPLVDVAVLSVPQRIQLVLRDQHLNTAFTSELVSIK